MKRPLRIAAAFAAAVAAGFAAASCASIQRDVYYDAPAGEDPAELAEIESSLVLSRAVPGAGDLAAARSRLAALAAAPSSDSARSARILALSAEAALQSGDRAAAARLLAGAKAAYQGDEVAAVVESRLAASPAERLAALQRSSATADGGYRVAAETGSALLALGRIREALVAFDASLPKLGEEYALLFGDERERAWSLRDAESAPSADASAYLTREPITMLGMAAVAQSETTAMDRVTGGAPWAAGVLFERLKAAGWYLDQGADAKAPATRKDAALFLWTMMSRGDRAMAARYTARYASRGRSPVPDVPLGSPYFDAVLGVVEEGVMALVDGSDFDPEGPASGLEFYGWLLAAAAWR